LEGAIEYCEDEEAMFIKSEEFQNYLESKKSLLFLNNGYDLNNIPDKYYNFIYSIACFIHVLHPAVRRNLYNEFYRTLKKDGRCCLMFFMGESENFGPAGEVCIDKGAFAFRNKEEVIEEFRGTLFRVVSLNESEPIKIDKDGGVKRYLFASLIKK